MIHLLVALILFALAVCPAPAVPAVVTAGMVAAVAPCPSVRTDCTVAARCARDTARSGRENRDRCAGGGSATAAGVAAIVPDVRVAAVAGAAGVDSLTVAQMP